MLAIFRFLRAILDIKLCPDNYQTSAKKNEIKVHIWTINDRNEMKNLIELGVDGIMTDYCRTLLDVTKRCKLAEKKIVLDPFLIT